jgi:hypothetical protein
MTASYAQQLQELLNEARYQSIMPALEQYSATPGLEDCLPLMTPQVIAGFAAEACNNVAALVEANGGDADDLVPPSAKRAFVQALERYTAGFDRFQQVYGQSGGAAWDRAADTGEAAGQLIGQMFGRVAGVLAAGVGGFFGANAVMQDLQAEGQRLQRAFQAFVEAYDVLMAALAEAAFTALGG